MNKFKLLTNNLLEANLNTFSLRLRLLGLLRLKSVVGGGVMDL
ncbi:MAG: hypothetical protein ACE5PV_15600 [Candidatus Poribacteria bacterium]